MSNVKNQFKHTLNLPKTDFPMKANLNQNEPMRLKKWSKIDIYKTLLNQATQQPKFIFHDGPPYANGAIHIGHLLNKVLKDIVVRSQYLLGKSCEFIPGWDCHGLPIEHKVLSELSPEKKQKLATLAADSERLAIRNECKKYAEKFIKLQSEQMKRLLTIADYSSPYLTFQPRFEANVLEVFSKMVKEGLVYRQLKPVHWSIANQTALAEAELEYMDKVSPTIAVKFKIEHHPFSIDGPLYAVIWTTTPWTIPANLAIAFGDSISYVITEIDQTYCIIAKERLPFIQEYCPSATVISEFDGRQLEGLIAEHPFAQRKSPLLSAQFVTTEEGTGLVHIAPGHGLDDYILGQQHQLDTYCPVQADGTYDETVPEWIQGQLIWDANTVIIKQLSKYNALLFSDEYSHSYPHDWRSKTPVIFRSTDQWFIGVDHPLQSNQQTLRGMALNAIQNEINFYPDWGKSRLNGMLEARPDWCISRQRAWGLPIPAFQDQHGTILLTEKSVQHIASQIQTDGSDVWFRKSANDLLSGYNQTNDPDAPSQFDVSSAFKLNDIFDVWFESGSSWFSVLSDRQSSEQADLYLEGSDQHRGWFHLSLLTSLAVNQHPPYKSLLTHGFIVDKDGRKMSKSSGNALTVDQILKNHGAEVTRWWVSSLSYENDIKVDESFFKEAGDLYRKIRNTLRFILSNLNDFTLDLDNCLSQTQTFPGHCVDAYVLQETARFEKIVLDFYAQYQFKDANNAIYQFCNDTLSSFYLTTIKDRLYC
ncbi:MAG: isoleucine--tRNA ligase, partial [Candidatus Margulisiibacteriota bacterium]